MYAHTLAGVITDVKVVDVQDVDVGVDVDVVVDVVADAVVVLVVMGVGAMTHLVADHLVKTSV